MAIVIKADISKEIKPFKKDLIKDCVKDRIYDSTIYNSNNYPIKTKHIKKLYKILLQYCNKHLNKFTIKDKNFKVWCYYSDDKFNQGNWHNHINTCTINAVLYLKIPKENLGIAFRHNGETVTYKPKVGELLIFPNYLEHFPYPSKNKNSRITLNLEIKCNEHPDQIYKIPNVN